MFLLSFGQKHKNLLLKSRFYLIQIWVFLLSNYWIGRSYMSITFGVRGSIPRSDSAIINSPFWLHWIVWDEVTCWSLLGVGEYKTSLLLCNSSQLTLSKCRISWSKWIWWQIQNFLSVAAPYCHKVVNSLKVFL